MSDQLELTKADLELQLKLLQKAKRADEFKIASLEMTLTSLKSTLSDAALRANQAEEMVTLLTSGQDMSVVAEAVTKHINQKANERAVHQQAIIQATVVSLNTALYSDEPIMVESVNTVVKGLTQALGTMHEISKQEKKANKPN